MFTQTVSKVFFSSLHLQWRFKFLEGESDHLAQKSLFYQNTTNKQSWKLSKIKFWPKSNNQIVLTQNHFETQLTCFISLLKIAEISSRKLNKMSKLEVWKIFLGLVLTKNLFCSDNRGQNICNKVKHPAKLDRFYTMFVILDIKFCLTCCNSNMY